MNTVKATWMNGQVVIEGNADWPEGRRLIVVEDPAAEIAFMTEGDQNDDPQAIQQWIDELRTIPPLSEDPSQEVERLAWQKEMKVFNLEAVRRQMEEGIP